MKVAILGGGLSGLSAAFFLKRTLPSCTPVVFEARNRVGGWLWSEHHGDFMFERGCRGLRPTGNGSHALELIEALGLEGEALLADKSAANRYVYLNGKLEGLLPGMVRDLSGAIRGSGATSIRTSDDGTPAGSDESLYDFFARRFSRTVAERLVDPMVSGIYAGNVHELSVRSVFPTLKQFEDNHGSVLLGGVASIAQRKPGGDTSSAASPPSDFVSRARKAASVSFRNGIDTLPNTLRDVLLTQLDTRVALGHRVVAVERLESPSTGVQVRVADGATGAEVSEDFDAVVCTLPAPALAAILPSAMTAASTALNAIPFVTVGVVSMGFKQQVLSKQGFGYLVPSTENQNMLGCVWDSCTFPDQSASPDHTRLTVMLGGAHHPEIESQSVDEITAHAQAKLRDHLGITAEPDTVAAAIHKACIPQYTVGHAARVAAVESSLQGSFGGAFVATGNSLHGIGSADCVANGKKAADAVAAALT